MPKKLKDALLMITISSSCLPPFLIPVFNQKEINLVDTHHFKHYKAKYINVEYFHLSNKRLNLI